MKKIIALFTVIFTISLLIGLQVVEVVDANPFNLKPVYDTISIQLPQNDSINTNPISLNFSVKRSDYTTACVYHYRIDGNASQRVNQITIITQTEIKNDANYHPYTDYTLEGNTVLPYLAEGWHNLTVYELGSATVSFYVNANSTSTSPTPNISTIPSLSTNPASSQSIISDLLSNQTNLLLIAIVIAIVAVALISLVYFRRRKGKP
jgi:hypothetical protein